MQENTPRDHALVVLASQQLWPNIQSMIHWQDRLSHLFIYHSEDKNRSELPALRLKQLCREHFEGVTVSLHGGPKSPLPQDVYRQITKWQEEHPELHWVINATGGTKLMSSGAMDCVNEPNVSCFYRELTDGLWYRLLRDGGKTLAVREDEVDESRAELLPALALLNAQWQGSDSTWVVNGQLEELPVEKMVQHGVDEGWNWRTLFKALGLPTKPNQQNKQGLLFEAFIASCLQRLGVTNLITNVELMDKENRKLQEIDLIANRHSSLFLVDCKLTAPQDDKESITSQIRQAAQTSRRLGGLGAKMLLLRPNRLLSDGERALCKANRLEVIDQNDAWELLSQLAKFVRATVPQEWRELEQSVQAQRDHGLTRAYCTEPARLLQLMSGESRALLCLDAIEKDKRHNEISYYKQEMQQDWAAFEDGEVIKLHIAKTTDANAKERLRQTMLSIADNVEINTTKKAYNVSLQIDVQGRRALIQDLETHLGRSLWSYFLIES